jgi:hypothetical protein
MLGAIAITAAIIIGVCIAASSPIRRFLNKYRWFKISLPNFRPFKRNTIKQRLKDVRVLEERFDPKAQARADAVTGEPNLRTDVQGSFEYGVRETMQYDLNRLRLQNETTRELGAIQVRLNREPPMPAVDDAVTLTAADERHESVLRAWLAPLKELKMTVLRAIRGVNAFRRENPRVLFRPPRTYNPLIVFPGMLAVCGIEMVLNYYILLGSGGHTPAEIVTIVVLASLFNLLFGLLAGFIGVRNLGYAPDVKSASAKRRAHLRRAGGFVALLMGCVLVVGLAFWMAHYRNAIDSALDDAATATNATLRLQRMAAAKALIAQTMRNDPMAFFGHLHAVLIFFLGLVFGTAAAFEGYYLIDDPYPGYGPVDRIFRRALEANANGIKAFEKEFTSTIQAIYEQLDEILQRGLRRVSEVKSSLDAATEMVARYEKAAAAVEHAFFRMVMSYRDEYRQTRDTPGPAHWEEEMPRLNREASFELNSFVEIEERTIADFQGLQDQIAQLRSKLEKSQADAVARMKAFLATVDQDAAREEELALNELFGVRSAPPPDMDLGGSAGVSSPRHPKDHPPENRAA